MTSQILTVDDVCLRVTSGGTPSRRISDYFEGAIPWLKTQELRDSWVYETEEHITQTAVENSSAKLLPANTVMMAMYGATVGKLAILGAEMTCNQAACAMIVDPNKADYRYLYYALLNDRSRIIDRANGAAQQNLSARTIKALEYRFPSVEEQRAIAATLGALDDKIESNRRAVEVSRELMRAHYEAVEKSLVRASEVLKPILGGTPKRSLPEYWRGGVKWASAKDIASASGGFVVETAETVSEEGVRNSAAKILPKGTIVMTARGTVGALARLAEPMAFNQSCYGLQAIDRNEASLFLALEAAVARIKDAGHGTVFNTVNMATFDQIEIEVPTSRRLDNLFQEMSAIVLQRLKENARLAVLRDTLLPELLSGRIRVQVEEAAA
ncbi:type I restriction enzyme, S subunit [Micrococcales bacterium KH10]|nr:type I restriction enzyme, S subunit [Micrococcales bacterium KH10]